MGKSILFVDDENDWRFMAETILKDSGYEVFTAKDGTEALLKSEGAKLNLIIVDVNLAGENGISLMKFLKRNHPDVPIILYTGMVHDESEVQAMLQAGAHQYLRKGTMEELVRVVQKAMAPNSTGNQGADSSV